MAGRWLLHGILVMGGLLLARPPLGLGAENADPSDIEFFEARIRPILVKHCYACHSSQAAKVRGGLLLDHRNGVLQGGNSGPAVIPGRPEESLLIQALKHQGRRMPPGEKLPAAVIEDFVHWVKIGAPDPRSEEIRAVASPADKAKDLWSLKPLSDPVVPVVQETTWPRTDIDRFILANLEAKGLKPVADAEPHVLLRRLHYVLTGLPPTLAERERFLEMWRRDQVVAVAQTVDELLASPHFGERWARHWLDLARYADVSGATAPVAYPQAWRYREYVIDAFNKDKPFDRFVREQLAGDLLPASRPEEKAANLIATGYLALFHVVAADRNPEKRRLDIVDEQLEVIGKTFLGMSLGCARCHDHKLDPITTRDYYALAGILRSTRSINNAKGDFGSGVPGIVALGKLPPTVPVWMRGADGGVMAVRDDNEIVDVAIRKGGDVDRLGPVVPRGFPVLLTSKPASTIPRNQSGRLQLADWLLSPDNPLVSRVIVNRIWHHVFGAGLVRTTDNFGTTGESPSHPELLDYLARRFREYHRGSFKSFIKELLLTRTWQLSASDDAKAQAVDPDNRLLWRAHRRRQDAEALHDAMMFVAGRLDLQPATYTVPETFKGTGNQGSTMHLAIPRETLYKRAIYWPVFRKDVPAALDMLSIFDMPPATSPCGTRAVSIVPSQALFLLNSPLVLECAEALAVKVRSDPELTTEAKRIDRLYLLLFGRQASAKEQQQLHSFLSTFVAQLGDRPDAYDVAWTRLCHTLLISNEFTVVE